MNFWYAIQISNSHTLLKIIENFPQKTPIFVFLLQENLCSFRGKIFQMEEFTLKTEDFFPNGKFTPKRGVIFPKVDEFPLK
jgi:hypothetical protein